MKVWAIAVKNFVQRHLVQALAGAVREVPGIGHGAVKLDERQPIVSLVWSNGARCAGVTNDVVPAAIAVGRRATSIGCVNQARPS